MDPSIPLWPLPKVSHPVISRLSSGLAQEAQNVHNMPCDAAPPAPFTLHIQPAMHVCSPISIIEGPHGRQWATTASLIQLEACAHSSMLLHMFLVSLLRNTYHINLNLPIWMCLLKLISPCSCCMPCAAVHLHIYEVCVWISHSNDVTHHFLRLKLGWDW